MRVYGEGGDTGLHINADPAVVQKWTKRAITMACGFFPGGQFISLGVEIIFDAIWPEEKEDVFLAMKDRIEQLVRTNIQTFYNQHVKQDLVGMCTAAKAYATEAKKVRSGGGNLESTRRAMDNAIARVRDHIDKFAVDDYKYDVLHFYAQAANLHLMLLRDKYNNWDKLGFNASDRDQAKADLAEYGKALIWKNNNWEVAGGGKYCQHVAKTYIEGQKRTLWHWSANAGYQREMYLAAWEYMVLWGYLADPDWKPQPISRDVELWLGPFGRCEGEFFDRWAKRAFPGPKRPEKPRLDWLKVWACEGALFAAAFRDVNAVWHQSGLTTHTDDEYSGYKGSGGGHSGQPPWRPKPGDYIEKVSVGVVKCHAPHYLRLAAFKIITKKGHPSHMAGAWYSDVDSHNYAWEFGIPDWQVSQVEILRNEEREDGPANWVAQCMVVGFRPVENQFTPENQKFDVQTGKSYHLVDPDSGRMLDWDRYTFTAPARAVLTDTPGARSSMWTAIPGATDGTWTFVNNYTGLPLTLQDGQAVQSLEPADAASWALTGNNDGTWALGNADSASDTAGTLGVDATSTAVLGAPATRWAILPAFPLSPSPDRHTLTITEEPSADHSGPTTTVRILTPEDTEPQTDWTLTFHLPTEAADGLQIGGGATLTSCEQVDRGVRVTVTGTEPLHPGRETTLTLTAAGTRLVPTDIDINGDLALI
ncbi:hypothetical protein GCM10010315_57350 [Streptomyces luteosporeus]|uniref:Pesticidal crystal protein domain-containing protein n=1 Tax=Streptomyces luteosporeus TaxID=173856 RepID=A0ABP6GPS8_9ACTN